MSAGPWDRPAFWQVTPSKAEVDRRRFQRLLETQAEILELDPTEDAKRFYDANERAKRLRSELGLTRFTGGVAQDPSPPPDCLCGDRGNMNDEQRCTHCGRPRRE